MTQGNDESILTTACFRLGLLGARVTQDFSDRIEQFGITHKQVGLLAVVDAGLARSQRDIAIRLQVTPSLVVSLADQLIEAGAITRTRSANDRRVQVIELTDHGRELLAASGREARELDREFRDSLSPSGQEALNTLLLELEAHHPTVVRP